MKLCIVGPNRTEIHFDNGLIVFFSYETPVAASVPGFGDFVTTTKYSRTTSKHITQWLDRDSAHPVAQNAINAMANGVMPVIPAGAYGATV